MMEPARQTQSDAHVVKDDDSYYAVDDSYEALKAFITNYRKENGRTYHRLSDGKYHGPNDELEQDRLDFAHSLWLLTWDGELCNCPKRDGANNVLELGTGTGIWAMEYADSYPEATVLGVDLSPIQPGVVPPNCYFEADDVEQEWEYEEPFDFIFMRAMVGSFRDWPSILAKAYDNLEPGGYVEIQDNEFPVRCDDNTMPEDSVVLKWTEYMVEATENIGQPIDVAPSFKRLVEEAGFVDVEERIAYWPVGTWPKDPYLKEIGRWCQSSMMQGIDSICLALFTRVLGWKKEEVLVFCAHVRNEVRKGNVHGYFPVYSVWGRKPK